MEDINAKRSNLERAIAALLEQFEKDTGVVVESVYIDRQDYIGAASVRRVRVGHTPQPGTQWR